MRRHAVQMAIGVRALLVFCGLVPALPAQAGWSGVTTNVMRAVVRAVEREPGSAGKALAGEVDALLAQHRLAEAMDRAALLGRLNADHGDATSRLLGQRLELAVSEARADVGLPAVRPAALAERAQDVRLRLEQLPAPTRPLVRTLQAADFGTAVFDVVDVSVKAFAEAFRRGADDPPRAWGRLDDAHRALVLRWQQVPRERRIFVIGGADDEAGVAALRSQLEPDWEVFFYRQCDQVGGSLCESEAVGAFFGSSGHTWVMDSAASRASGFVRVEIATARRALGLQRPFLLVDTQQLRRAADSGQRAVGLLGVQGSRRCGEAGVECPQGRGRAAPPAAPRR